MICDVVLKEIAGWYFFLSMTHKIVKFTLRSWRLRGQYLPMYVKAWDLFMVLSHGIKAF